MSYWQPLRSTLSSCVSEPAYRGKGMGLEAAQLMMAYGMRVITFMSVTIQSGDNPHQLPEIVIGHSRCA